MDSFVPYPPNNPRPPEPKCLTQPCPGVQQTRGLCAACYTAFRRCRDSGELSEADAVAAGFILPRFAAPRRKRAKTEVSG